MSIRSGRYSSRQHTQNNRLNDRKSTKIIETYTKVVEEYLLVALVAYRRDVGDVPGGRTPRLSARQAAI